MPPLLAHRLLFVTGKGGVGKTTVSAALAMASAARGRRTIVCELGAQARLPAAFGHTNPGHGEEVHLADDLWSVTIDPHHALEEWFSNSIGRAATAVLARSNTFGYFVAAAPGARELLTMSKVWDLAQPERWRRKAESYELVVVDAPATGHALGLLRTPAMVGDLARVGPIGGQAARVRDFLADEEATAVIAVSLPSEMPVTETLQLDSDLRAQTGRPLAAVVANGVLPRRLAGKEVERLEQAVDGRRAGSLKAAVRAARSERTRARAQQEQLERLRRGAGAPVVELPFVFEPRLRHDELRLLALELDMALA